ncbi:hypothetical protein BHE74_00022772 [Ensete ventricosum]|uniref:Uncharacterized protein n=1 Tax=Ensete ventricosum TaxID=4639 RepID=A0A444D515_ENSVE|nr:hypothetical protein GW17_00044386 [Ensete ventricosum]RWW69639.1 hypothetical protein BHE74_00022772 [Ensete ventricosum]RZR70541.1 hypothetical protein BHM03_00000393 [Ensete ventricosum]
MPEITGAWQRTSDNRWLADSSPGVILSVCDEEVARYETANLTAAAVPALLLPPPTNALDEHLDAALPALEPYARLFHRYYALATPSATQRLLLGLLEAPPSWAPDALDAAVQLVELLRAAEDYASGVKLPRNWMHLHFLRAIGIAMSMRVGVAADAAAALLFRILSQPTLLFPPLRHAEGIKVHHEPVGGYISPYKRQLFPLISKSRTCLESARMAKVAKGNGAAHELCNSITSAVCHSRRILGILEALFSLKPSSIGTSWSYSSNEIVAAAMVAAHVSELFGRSKACMNALSVLMRCKWDTEISTRASSLYHLIDIHGKNVASIVHKAEPLEAHLVRSPAWKDDIACSSERDLQPWIARDDEQGQKLWRINQRIIKLIVELMRNHDSPEALMILAGASDILLRATDGMLVDGEACTLPQLEVTSELD